MSSDPLEYKRPRFWKLKRSKGEESGYWNWWRILCMCWNAFVILFFLWLLVMWLVNAPVPLNFTGLERWQGLLLTLTPVWTLVTIFSMAGEAPPGMM